MYETLLRPYEVSQVPTLQPISAVSQKLKQSEKRREEKRIRQIAASRSRTVEKRKRSEVANGGEDEEGKPAADDDDDADGKEKGTKRVKTDNEPAADVVANSSVQGQLPSSTLAIGQGDTDVKMDSPTTVPTTLLEAEDTTEPTTQFLAKVMSEVRGHTSYLTFAVLLPAIVEQVQATTEAQKDGATPAAIPETEQQIITPLSTGDDTQVSRFLDAIHYPLTSNSCAWRYRVQIHNCTRNPMKVIHPLNETNKIPSEAAVWRSSSQITMWNNRPVCSQRAASIGLSNRLPNHFFSLLLLLYLRRILPFTGPQHPI